MKYLFICGCARSGTSVLAQLLGNHGKIIMGMERYGHLEHAGDFRLTPGHFKKDRFFRIEKGDTFYDDFNMFHRWDKRIKEKFESVLYIGDKRPPLYLVYDELFKSFPGVTVIFIYRDIYDVAASWNKRAQEGDNWPITNNYKKATYAWNESLSLTVNALEAGKNIIPIKYEDIFFNKKSIRPLYDLLGIEMDETTVEKYKNVMTISDRMIDKRKLFCLNKDQAEFVKLNASFRFIDQLDKFYNLLYK